MNLAMFKRKVELDDERVGGSANGSPLEALIACVQSVHGMILEA